MASDTALQHPDPSASISRAMPSWRKLARTRLSGVLLLLAMLLLWEVSARFWVESDNWPPFSHVLRALVIERQELFSVFLSSLRLMLTGFILGGLAGVIIGFATGVSTWLRRALTPTLEFLRPLPVPGIVPPLILLLGIDDAMKTVVVAFSTVFPVLINTAQGVRSVDPTLTSMARTFRRSKTQTMLSLILPASLPYVFSGFRISIALALIVTVVAEMIAGGEGIGYYLMTMQYAMQPEKMYAGVILLAATGYALNFVFSQAERHLLHWYRAGSTG